MPLDGAAIAAIRTELEEKLIDGRIEKIYQPERDEISLIIRRGADNHRLLISADSSNPRIHLTNYNKKNPEQAPMFCMILRKHLQSGRIIKINQPDYERVLEIYVECYNDLGDLVEKRLIAEIMGRNSNIVLVGDGMRIIECIKRVDLTVSSVRTLLPGLGYEPPPAQGKIIPINATYDEIFEALCTLDGEPPISRAVVSLFMGMSPLAGREIAHRSAGHADARLTADNLKAAAKEAAGFFERLKREEFSPSIILGDGDEARDFAAYEVSLYEGMAKIKPCESISRAMDEYYYLKDMRERMRQKTANVRKTVTNLLERAKKKLVLLQESLHEAENKEQFKEYGELITANLYRIKQGDEVLEAQNFYDGNKLVLIPLEKNLSPSKNAQRYFKKYKKAKNAEVMVKEQIEKTVREINYLESVLNSVDMADGVEEIAEIKRELSEGGYIKREKEKKSKKDKPAAPLRLEVEGFEIYVGKNNKQNDMVTFKIGRSRDIWLHVKNMPGSHVIIKNPGNGVPDEIIEKGARLAAYYSSARQSPMADIDYTEVKNVKKLPGAAPGMVIYEKYKTARVPPHRL